MQNKIISIGFIGLKRCYLNVDEKEAIKRYCISEKISIEEFDDSSIDTILFDDEFGAYSLYYKFDESPF